jgi:plasmid stabilization system protein ParE
MYKVLMRQTAHDSLREIVSYVSTDNPTAAEKLGNELVNQALRLESLAFRGSRVRKTTGLLEACPRQLPYLRSKRLRAA